MIICGHVSVSLTFLGFVLFLFLAQRLRHLLFLHHAHGLCTITACNINSGHGWVLLPSHNQIYWTFEIYKFTLHKPFMQCLCHKTRRNKHSCQLLHHQTKLLEVRKLITEVKEFFEFPSGVKTHVFHEWLLDSEPTVNTILADKIISFKSIMKEV